MDRLLKLYESSKDVVFELCLKISIDELEGFFDTKGVVYQTYPEFKYLLSNRMFMD